MLPLRKCIHRSPGNW